MISSEDEKAIRKLGEAFDSAWNSHDMDALSSLVTPEVDFVTVAGGWLGGREAFRKYHSERHATQFKNSVRRTKGMAIRPLTPDICVVHSNWSHSGDTDPDGIPRQPREGVFMWIVRREGSRWLIDVAQNTNINPQVVTAEYRKTMS